MINCDIKDYLYSEALVGQNIRNNYSYTGFQYIYQGEVCTMFESLLSDQWDFYTFESKLAKNKNMQYCDYTTDSCQIFQQKNIETEIQFMYKSFAINLFKKIKDSIVQPQSGFKIQDNFIFKNSFFTEQLNLDNLHVTYWNKKYKLNRIIDNYLDFYITHKKQGPAFFDKDDMNNTF